MYRVQLELEDGIYEKVMFLLKNLNVQGLKIKEETYIPKKQKEAIEKLFENKNIELFQSIADPMQWQNKQREEWK